MHRSSAKIRRTPRGPVERALDEVARGRFEQSLSALTAMSAAVTGAEVYLEHCRGSFPRTVRDSSFAWCRGRLRGKPGNLGKEMCR